MKRLLIIWWTICHWRAIIGIVNGCSSVATSSRQSPCHDYYTSHTLLHLTEYVGAYKLRNTLLIDFNFKLYAFFLKPPLLLLSASFWEICLSVVNANLFGQVNKNCKGSIRMPWNMYKIIKKPSRDKARWAMCVSSSHINKHTCATFIAYIFLYIYLCVYRSGHKAENAPPTPRKIVGQFHFIFAVSRGAKCAWSERIVNSNGEEG